MTGTQWVMVCILLCMTFACHQFLCAGSGNAPTIWFFPGPVGSPRCRVGCLCLGKMKQLVCTKWLGHVPPGLVISAEGRRASPAQAVDQSPAPLWTILPRGWLLTQTPVTHEHRQASPEHNPQHECTCWFSR